jgi:Flp pilus assembly protein TadB
MNAKQTTHDHGVDPRDDTAERGANGVDGRKSRDYARRAKAAMMALPSRLDEGMEANPRAALFVACAAGMAVGVVLSSRILRSVLATAATVAAAELTRTILRQKLGPLLASPAH